MQVAVLSDIHANKPALDAVLNDIADRGIDRYICCGDLAGYYCWPNAVIETAQEHDFLAVRGNHDEALVQDTGFGVTGAAGQALDWTRSELSSESRRYLAELPYSRRETLAEQDIYVVHGSPRAPVEEYVYPQQVRDGFFTDQGIQNPPDILLLGHTHVPFTEHLDGSIVVNPGSVGQPRDGTPEASFAVIDLDGLDVAHHRVSYDIDAVAEQVHEEGLPVRLARRLYDGR
jgi:putative phosphoesterase